MRSFRIHDPVTEKRARDRTVVTTSRAWRGRSTPTTPEGLTARKG